MRIGTFLPTYWEDYGAAGEREAIEETARAAQALGYASIWANDHVIAPASRSSMGHIVEPFITLASVMHLAPDLQVGTSTLVLPQRNAILVAKQAAALDVLSGGRLLLGLGVGWLAEEFAMLGADYARRGRVADEAIAAMQCLWRDDPATFQGHVYHFADAVMHPKPVSGRIPLWICGNTPAAIRRAARFGDAWNPFGPSLPEYQAGVGLLRTQTRERMPLLAAHLQIRIGDLGDRVAHVAGEPEEVAATLAAYGQAGLAYLICDFVADDVRDLLRQMETMAQQIAPSLRTEGD